MINNKCHGDIMNINNARFYVNMSTLCLKRKWVYKPTNEERRQSVMLHTPSRQCFNEGIWCLMLYQWVHCEREKIHNVPILPQTATCV